MISRASGTNILKKTRTSEISKISKIPKQIQISKISKILANSIYLLLPIASACLVILLIVFSEQSILSARDALSLCFLAVIPTLFPFFLLSNVIVDSGFPKLIGHFAKRIMGPLFNLPGSTILPFLLGLTAGYPTGASITVSMYKEHQITEMQAERLLGFTNNSSPLFITGAVAVGMLKMPEIGLGLFFCHAFSAVLVGIIFGIASRIKKAPSTKNNSILLPQVKIVTQTALDISKEIIKNIKKNPGYLIGDALKKALSTTLLVCGFVLFFSILFGIAQSVLKNEFSFFPLLLLEITNGNSQLAQAAFPISLKLVLISFVTGFGGISVFMQVAAICANAKLNLTGYIQGKLLQGIIAAVLAYIIF